MYVIEKMCSCLLQSSAETKIRDGRAGKKRRDDCYDEINAKKVCICVCLCVVEQFERMLKQKNAK